MKHNLKVTLILIGMFFITQLIGLAVVNSYFSTGKLLPYGLEPPQVDAGPGLASIIFSFIIAIAFVFLLMRIKADYFLRIWFFLVVIIAIGVTLTSLFTSINIQKAAIVALVVSIPLAYIKVFRRNIIIHNLTELAIYPGIATVFIPILNIWTIVVLLLLISAYDIYAVWHAGFMQKMAKYQINKLKFFTGFFVPYMKKEDRILLKSIKNKKSKAAQSRLKNIRVNLAILGGGDVVFPIIMAGVVLRAWGMLPALMIALFATIAVSLLFMFSTKGKFYPAMPFITAGCFAGLLFSWLVFVM